MTEVAARLLAEGLALLGRSYYAKETRRRNGANYPATILARAEDSFMVNPASKVSVGRGLDLLRDSWAYRKTRTTNVIPSRWKKTLMAQAEVKFEAAWHEVEFPAVGGLAVLNGLQHVNPRGGDFMAEAKASGFDLVGYNVGDFPTQAWVDAGFIDRAQRNGIEPVPWRRSLNQQESIALCQEAVSLGRRKVIHNIEKEIETTFPVAALVQVVKMFPTLQHGWQPDPWVPNSISVIPLADVGVVTIVEAYANQDARYLPTPLAQHARDQGADAIAATFGAGVWAVAPHEVPPAVYLKNWPRESGPYWVYPADGKPPHDWARP
jgi:hypothetical protein